MKGKRQTSDKLPTSGAPCLTKGKEMIDLETGEIVGTVPEEMNGLTVPFMRTMYNYDRKAASDETATICPEPTRTQQQFKDEVDINVMMEKFGITGEWPQNVRPVMNDEYTEVFDFQSAMNTIRRAQEAFMELPAEQRAVWDNDPGKFATYLEDPDNHEKARKMGLLIVRPKEEVPEIKAPKETPKE